MLASIKINALLAIASDPTVLVAEVWLFLFYVLVFKIFLCCWRLMYVFIFLVKLR